MKKMKFFENTYYVFCLIFHYDKMFFIVMASHIAIKAILPIWLIYVPKHILEILLSGSDSRKLIAALGFVAVISVILQTASIYLESRYESKIGLIRTNCFRVRLIKKLLIMRYSILEQTETLKLIERAWNVSWSNNHGIEDLLRQMAQTIGTFFTLLGFAGVLIEVNPFIPIVLILLTVGNLSVIKKNGKTELKMRDEEIELERRMNYINETMQDLTAGKDIRIMGIGTLLYTWHQMLIGQSEELLKAKHKKFMTGDVVQTIVTVVRDLLIYGILIYSVWTGKATIAEFTLYLGAAVGFSNRIMGMLGHYERMRQDARCISDMREMMELPEEEMTEQDDAEIDNVNDTINELSVTFEHVSYRYPGAKNDAIHDFSYTFLYGQCIAVVGRNGSGKTTLTKLICGLIEPTSGKITFCGKEVTKIKPLNRYALFGVVFQDINQYAFTLGENITFVENYDRLAVRNVLKRTELDTVDFSRGLDTMLQKNFDPAGIDLSGGQKQELAIARVLWKANSFVVLDEPTAALDPIAEDRVYSRFAELVQGRGAIYISHRLASTRFCNRIIVLEKGMIIESGTHDQLIAKEGYYADMFLAQSSYYRAETSNRYGEEL